MAPSRIFYDYSNRLYGSRARAGVLIPGPDLVKRAAAIDIRNLILIAKPKQSFLRRARAGLSKKVPPQAAKFIQKLAPLLAGF